MSTPTAPATKPVTADIQLMLSMLTTASARGAFKLPHFEQVAASVNVCRRVLGTQDPPPSLNLQELVLILKLLEFAANANGFGVDDYAIVAKTIRELTEMCKQVDSAQKGTE